MKLEVGLDLLPMSRAYHNRSFLLTLALKTNTCVMALLVPTLAPHVLWASGCWHYERTLYSRRPLKETGVSIYLPTLSKFNPSLIEIRSQPNGNSSTM